MRTQFRLSSIHGRPSQNTTRVAEPAGRTRPSLSSIHGRPPESSRSGRPHDLTMRETDGDPNPDRVRKETPGAIDNWDKMMRKVIKNQHVKSADDVDLFTCHAVTFRAVSLKKTELESPYLNGLLLDFEKPDELKPLLRHGDTLELVNRVFKNAGVEPDLAISSLNSLRGASKKLRGYSEMLSGLLIRYLARRYIQNAEGDAGTPSNTTLRRSRFAAIKEAGILDRASEEIIRKELYTRPTRDLVVCGNLPVLGMGNTAGLTTAWGADSPEQRVSVFETMIKGGGIKDKGIVMAPEYFNTRPDFCPLSKSEFFKLIPKYMDLSSRYPGVLLIPGTFLVDLGNNRVINRAVVFKDGDIYHQYDKDIPFTYVDVPPGKKFTSLEWEPTFDYEGKRFAIQICADNICPDTNYPKADILVFLSAPQSLFPEQREQYPIILHADGYEDFRVVQPGL